MMPVEIVATVACGALILVGGFIVGAVSALGVDKRRLADHVKTGYIIIDGVTYRLIDVRPRPPSEGEAR